MDKDVLLLRERLLYRNLVSSIKTKASIHNVWKGVFLSKIIDQDDLDYCLIDAGKEIFPLSHHAICVESFRHVLADFVNDCLDELHNDMLLQSGYYKSDRYEEFFSAMMDWRVTTNGLLIMQAVCVEEGFDEEYIADIVSIKDVLNLSKSYCSLCSNGYPST